MIHNHKLIVCYPFTQNILATIFYEQDGQIFACSQDPITLEADSPQELEIYLKGLQEALTLPILQFEDLPPIPDHLPIVQRGTPLEALWEELGLERDELAIAFNSGKSPIGVV